VERCVQVRQVWFGRVGTGREWNGVMRLVGLWQVWFDMDSSVLVSRALAGGVSQVKLGFGKSRWGWVSCALAGGVSQVEEWLGKS